MQIGIDSFVATLPDALTGKNLAPEDRLSNLLEEIMLADEVRLDSFGIGEHHRPEFLDSAPEIILAAASVKTKRIRLNSAVTVLGANDPVRLFQQFATIDLLSRGRVEMIVGRGSFVEAYPLFGLELRDYDSLFTDKLDLLLNIRAHVEVTWSGKHRSPLHRQRVYPRPLQNPLPIWLGVGGTPSSFERAGALGLPLMVAMIGGQTAQFRPSIDLYRESGRRAGHSPEKLVIGVHVFGYVADTDRQAADEFFPGYAKTIERMSKERRWSPVTRDQFEAMRGPTGALVVSDPESVAEKIIAIAKTLGGISRITFQMSAASLPHAKHMHAIELLGQKVAPLVRQSASLPPSSPLRGEGA